MQGCQYLYENQGAEFTLRAAPLSNARWGIVEKEWTYTSTPNIGVQRKLLERYRSNKTRQVHTATAPAKPA